MTAIQNSPGTKQTVVARLIARWFIGLALCMACIACGQSPTRPPASQGVDSLAPSDALTRMRRVHTYIEQNGFTGDSANNLVVLDYQSPTPITSGNWAAHVMYGLNRGHVETVISDGRVVVRDGRCTLVDEQSIYRDACIQAQRLWDKL